MNFTFAISYEDGTPVKMTPMSKQLHITISAEDLETASDLAYAAVSEYLGANQVYVLDYIEETE